MGNIIHGFECMAFEDCPEELVISAVDKNKNPIDFDKIRPDELVCIKRR